MESGKKRVTVRVWVNDRWQCYNTRVIPDEGGQVSMEEIWLTLKETKNVPLTTTKGFRFSYHHFAVCRCANLVLPWDARVDPSTTPTLYLTRYDDGDAEDSGDDEDDDAGGGKRPDLKQILRDTEKEEAEEAETKRKMTELANKDWDRDFGHCFPNLREGLAEDIAELQAKRQKLEEDEEEGP